MATGLQNQGRVPEKHLRRLLAVAVGSIQWSYAIFWSISSRQGALEWGDGYYNGDIKTRKTVQPWELNVDKLGLKRSEQLRELYGSLSEGDNNQQARRSSAALSPEDLTDAEWYYLVCMSFTFNPGQGLPGRTFAKGEHIWLCNAHHADSSVFSRSLLAKTVVCFPFLGGVIELGVSELVLEDPTLLQHIKTFFLEFPMPNCSEKSTSSPWIMYSDDDLVCTELDHDFVDTLALEKFNPVGRPQAEGGSQFFPSSILPYIPKEENEFDQEMIKEMHANICEELKSGSPHESSNGCEPNHQTGDSFMLEGVNGGASQVQNWQFMDDEFSNCVHGSMNSSDCISQTVFNSEMELSSPKRDNRHLRDLQESNHSKLSSLDLGTDDLHYTRTLSAIFKNSDRLIVAPYSCSGNHQSSFRNWKKGDFPEAQKLQIGTPQKILKKILFNAIFKYSCRLIVAPYSSSGNHQSSFTSWKKGDFQYAQKLQIGNTQKILKKILFEVAQMHSGFLMKSQNGNGGKDGLGKPEGVDFGMNPFSLERKSENEKYLILRSLVPSISKFEKASILGDTIEYLKELERRVEELESCGELVDFEAKGRRKHLDIVERTSDNYGSNNFANGQRLLVNKRKACNIDKIHHDLHWVLPNDDLAVDVTVCMIEKEVLIDMHCPWRECLLLEIMEVISNLHLDAHSVQSSTTAGILTLTLKSKFRGAVVASAGMIKQAIQRVVGITTYQSWLTP